MPVRLRITLLFSLVVFFILGLVCAGVYYFSFQERINTIKTRLTNRALTTARLLSQRETFDPMLIRKIDSVTSLSLKAKTFQAYNRENRQIYVYSDIAGDTLAIHSEILDEARSRGSYYFLSGGKEAVAYHYQRSGNDLVIVSAARDEEGSQYLSVLLRILIIGFIIGNLLVVAAGYFFSAGLLLPVKRISMNVAEISAQNLTRRIKTGNIHDEWFQLSSTLNELLDRLQHSFEVQQRFIANASHELSTPLTSILSQLEVSMQRERDAEAYLKVMQSIYQDVLHMRELTKTLLEFAKASGTRSGLEIELVRMDEVVLKLPAEMAKNHVAYAVKIDFGSLPEKEEKLLVFGNETLLFTAIKNIVSNACKYSDDHIASVKLFVRDEEVVIKVTNTGAGIEEKDIQNIFQPFFRTDGSRQEGGFGLGLSLAERIIKIHKGKIEVNSVPFKETSFIITIPAAVNAI